MYSKTFKKILIAVLIVLIGIGVCAILLMPKTKDIDTIDNKEVVDEQKDKTNNETQEQDGIEEAPIEEGGSSSDNVYTMPDLDDDSIVVYIQENNSSNNSSTSNKKPSSEGKKENKDKEEDKEPESSESESLKDYVNSYFEELKKQNGYKKLGDDDEDTSQETTQEVTTEPKKLVDDVDKKTNGEVESQCTPPV